MCAKFAALCRVLIAVALFAVVSPAHAARGVAPSGYIVIERIGLYEPIYEVPLIDRAYQMDDLGIVVGHLQATGWIHDAATRTVLAGHSPGVFFRVHELRPGDRLIVWDSAGVVQYSVERMVIVSATEWRWLASQGRAELMLITCEGDGVRRLIIAGKD